MKKTVLIFAALVLSVVGAAIWFSPLGGRGAYAYYDNEPICETGLTYPEDTTVRYDFSGSEADMYRELERMGAKVVKTAFSGGTAIVYAFSARVAAEPQYLENGAVYNVMAAYSNGRVAIGTPLLSGSY